MLLPALVCLGCASSRPEAAKTPALRPITGSFGWNLGDKLPDKYLLPADGIFCPKQPAETTAPYVGVGVYCLKDRTVYQIEAFALVGIADEILQGFKDQYGPPAVVNSALGADYWWSYGDCRLHVFVDEAESITVQYINDNLSKRHEAGF